MGKEERQGHRKGDAWWKWNKEVTPLHIRHPSALPFPSSMAEQDWRMPSRIACLQGRVLKKHKKQRRQVRLPSPLPETPARHTEEEQEHVYMTSLYRHNYHSDWERCFGDSCFTERLNYKLIAKNTKTSCQDKQVLPRHWGIFTLPALCLYRSIQIVMWVSWSPRAPGHRLMHRPGLRSRSMFKTDTKGCHTQNSLTSPKASRRLTGKKEKGKKKQEVSLGICLREKLSHQIFAC